MKIIFRLFGISLCFVLAVIILTRFININIIDNDLNNITAIAINQTQEEMLKQMLYLQKEGSIQQVYPITNNLSYQEYFKECFYSFIKEKYQKLYSIKECLTDFEKGIISVCAYSKRFPLVKDVKLTSIIEMPSSGICSLTTMEVEKENGNIAYGEKEKRNIPQGKRWNELLKNTTWPKEIYRWEFEEIVKVSSFDIGINYCVSSALDDEYLYWYPGLRLIGIKEDGSSIILGEKEENDCDGIRRLMGNCDAEVIEVRLEITSYNPDNGQQERFNRITTINNDSAHPSSFITVQRRDNDKTEEITIKECDDSLAYYRFIDKDQKNLNDNSLWHTKEYQEVLKEFTQ